MISIDKCDQNWHRPNFRGAIEAHGAQGPANTPRPALSRRGRRNWRTAKEHQPSLCSPCNAILPPRAQTKISAVVQYNRSPRPRFAQAEGTTLERRKIDLTVK